MSLDRTRWLRDRWPECAAASLALICRLGFLAAFAGTALWTPLDGGHDRTLYHVLAKAVAGGQVWPPDAFAYLPLYPWTLGAVYALVGSSLWAAALFGAACDTLTAALLVRLARRLGAGAWVAAAAGAAYAAYPLAIVYATLTMPNTLNVLLVTGLAFGLHAAPRDRWAAWAGLGLLAGVAALGFAGLVLIVTTLVAGWILVRRGAPRAACVAAFLAAFVLPITPVAIHNSRAEGRFVLLTTHGGFNLYMGNNERATGYPVRVRDFRMTARDMLEDAHRAAEQAVGRPLTRSESSAWWAGQARAFWREHPRAALKLLVRKVALAWNHAEVDDLRMVEQLRLVARQFVSPLWPGFALFAFFGLLGLLRAPRATEVRIVALAGMAGLVLFFVTARYRLTFVPLLAALGAAGVTAIAGDVRARRAVLGTAVQCAGAALLVFAPLSVRDLRPVDHYNASIQMLAAGRMEAALQEARAGLDIDPLDANLWHAQGSAFFRKGEYAEAAGAFSRCLELDPSHPNAAFNLALSLAHAGDYCEARQALVRANQIQPLSGQARQLLAELSRACPDAQR